MNGGGSPPNTAMTALVQTQLNKDAATSQQKMNMVNQANPYGSLTYAADPNSPGGYTATTTLAPDQQALLDQQNGLKKQVGGIASSLVGSGAGALSGKPLDLSWNATEANLDALNRSTMDPQWNQQKESLDASLYNKGVAPGSAAYDTAMRNFGQQKSDAYNNMYLQGHNTAVNDITNQYNSPLNTLASLANGSQPTTPNQSFVSTPQEQIQPVDYMGAVNQQYQQQQSQNAAQMGGIFGTAGTLGSAAIKWSDRRLKKNIERVGTLDNGLPVYAYEYVWGGPREIGVMAQDVEAVTPAAVHNIGGLKAVDYGMATRG